MQVPSEGMDSLVSETDLINRLAIRLDIWDLERGEREREREVETRGTIITSKVVRDVGEKTSPKFRSVSWEGEFSYSRRSALYFGEHVDEEARSLGSLLWRRALMSLQGTAGYRKVTGQWIDRSDIILLT